MRPAREVPPGEDVVPRGEQEENGEEDEGEVARADGDVVKDFLVLGYVEGVGDVGLVSYGCEEDVEDREEENVQRLASCGDVAEVVGEGGGVVASEGGGVG